jgi:DNA-binding NarL/FixJ family response regulator
VFCDLSMPRVSGVDVHRAVCEFHLDLMGRFVFLTDGVTDECTERYIQSSGAPVLTKPVPRAEFEALLAGML